MRRVVLLSPTWGWSFLLRKGFSFVLVGALVILLLTSCGSTSGGGGGVEDRCGADTQEPLDPGSLTHLLPGAAEPVYSSDPPTSGPHLAGGAPQGAQDEPVPRPAQVALLEAGGVMLQYRDLTPADLRRLRTLSEREVVVAPNPNLASPVVATAWRHRLACGSASGPALDDLESFVDTHKGNGPDQDAKERRR